MKEKMAHITFLLKIKMADGTSAILLQYNSARAITEFIREFNTSYFVIILQNFCGRLIYPVIFF